MTIAKVGKERTEEVLERETEEEVQNDVAAKPLGIASYELEKMRWCVRHSRHHVAVQHHPRSMSSFSAPFGVTLLCSFVFFFTLIRVCFAIKIKLYPRPRPCLLDGRLGPFHFHFAFLCVWRALLECDERWRNKQNNLFLLHLFIFG